MIQDIFQAHFLTQNINTYMQNNKRTKHNNAMQEIYPYWNEHTWVFDDEAVGLLAEPFVLGIDQIITNALKRLGILEEAKKGFRMTFAEQAFPGFESELTFDHLEAGGAFYTEVNTHEKGWLCPAMFLYFSSAPQYIFARYALK